MYSIGDMRREVRRLQKRAAKKATIEVIPDDPSLAEFCQGAWTNVLYPGRRLQWSPSEEFPTAIHYLDVLCMHLEAVSRGEQWAKRLLITTPPNTLKSTIVSVCWPAWHWIKYPQTRFLFASGSKGVTTRDAMFNRKLIESAWYREKFGIKWTLQFDQKAKTRYFNTMGGYRISCTSKSIITGEKGDIVCFDDINDAKKVRSGVERRAVNEWMDHAYLNRTSDEIDSPIVGIGQRLHREDGIGHCLEQGDWTQLMFDEEFDPLRKAQTPIWQDPRRETGELLRPHRFGPKQIEQRRRVLGPSGYASQHRQNPGSSENSWFDGGLVRIIPELPNNTIAIRAWDTARTESETACYTAGVLLGWNTVTKMFVILDVVRGRWTPGKRNTEIRNTAIMDKRLAEYGIDLRETVIEEDGDTYDILRILADIYVRAERPYGDKDTRLRPFAGQWESKNVVMVEGRWNRPYFDEMGEIPGASSDYRDQGDATSLAYNALVKHLPFLIAD